MLPSELSRDLVDQLEARVRAATRSPLVLRGSPAVFCQGMTLQPVEDPRSAAEAFARLI
ncbi:MAG: hypothetical protein R3F61_30385 [Myxococcota bacterium]